LAFSAAAAYNRSAAKLVVAGKKRGDALQF